MDVSHTYYSSSTQGGLATELQHENRESATAEDMVHFRHRLKDHLGNTVVLFGDKDGNGAINSEYDYYDPSIGRFMGVDPLAEKYTSTSPYVYVLNNPMQFTDPTGMSVEGNDWIPEANEDGSISYVAEEGDSYDSFVEQYGEQAAQNTFAQNCGNCIDKSATYGEGDLILNNSNPLKLIIDNKSVSSSLVGQISDMLSGGTGKKTTTDIQDIYDQLEFINSYDKDGQFKFNDYFSDRQGSSVGSFSVEGSIRTINNGTWKSIFIGYNRGLEGNGLIDTPPQEYNLPGGGYKREYRAGSNTPLLITHRNY